MNLTEQSLSNIKQVQLNCWINNMIVNVSSLKSFFLIQSTKKFNYLSSEIKGI